MSIQARLEAPDVAESEGTDPDLSDPVGLFRHLETSGRFHRDSGVGRMFHPGSVSLRENVATDSLHIVIHHDRVAAHVDRVSPLRLHPARPPRYSLQRAIAHNLAGMSQDALRLLRGRQGDHRSELACRWGWDPSTPGPDGRDLLDPSVSAWSLHIEVRVGGTLDEARLRAALDQVLGERPADHDVVQVVDCPDDDHLGRARAQLQAAPVRVTEWPPMRLRLARHPDGDVLMLNVNHAASDGFGALSVLGAIADGYAGTADPGPGRPWRPTTGPGRPWRPTTGPGRPWRPTTGPKPDFLAARDLPVHPAANPVSPWMAWSRSAIERARDVLARPAQLAPEQADSDPGYGFHLVRLSAEETERVVDAERPGTSRNVLLAALHLAIRDWNRLHHTPAHRIGVLVQVNLRPPQWRPETIGNLSVTARVSTSRRHRRDGATALAAITSQTTRNKRTRSGIALVAGLDRAGMLALWAKQSLIVLQPLTRNRLIDTAMVGNLGVLTEPPSFGPDAGETVEVWFSAPSRAPRSLCIGAVTARGRLHLVVRYPHHVLGPDAARRFAECYRAQLLVVAASRGHAR